ncbi:Ubiquitin-conjugating enzyme E2C-binding protein [Penicillium chermesinum]|nr:Ubiquitin-conjugating enzyme E2C-binding protein [Penicillium chermesinum]
MDSHPTFANGPSHLQLNNWPRLRLECSPLPIPPLYLHAELLPNIRQITLYVSLPSHPALNGLHPTIQLSDSRKAVTVSLPHPFQDVTETTKLPARVSEAARRILTTHAHPAKPPSHDYSFRMPIDPTDPVLAPSDELTDDYVPWTAGDMSPDTRIRCRSCSAELLNTTPPQRTSQDETSGGGWDWKDLPSGNWAEMMDFWHCHKPDPHEEDAEPEANAALRVEEQNAQIKGYGASSRVVATTGTVLTSEEKPSNLHDPEQRSLACTSCNAVLGTEDPSVNGWRLLKAHVSISTNQSIQSYSAEVIIAAQLLELIERESARRFVVHSGQKSGLLVCALNFP